MKPLKTPSRLKWYLWSIGGPRSPILVWVIVLSVLALAGMGSLISLLALIALIMLLAVREVTRRAALRLCRTATARDGKSCSYCSFDLQGVAAIGHCPECGHGYAAADLQEVWTDTERWIEQQRWYT